MDDKQNTSRVELIEKIEKARNSHVICYITGDRDKFNTQIGEDVIPILFRHLELIGNQDNIDFFVYTRGGEMVVPIRIVKLIRNYCKKFGILIPFRAHSAGTLIALGADEIIMTKLGELTPVDPRTRHPFNPIDGKNILEISVEDITSYLLLAKEKGNVSRKRMHDIYNNLTKHSYSDPKHLHPLALGNVYRAQRMIRDLSKKLLNLHTVTGNFKKRKIVKKIVNEITSDICIHNYPIYRDEAKDLGLNVILPNEELEKLLWQLYEKYANDMELQKQFSPVEILGGHSEISIKYGAANIESVNALDTFYFNIRINEIKTPQALMPSVNVQVISAAWEKVR